jgi:hypothetical protein
MIDTLEGCRVFSRQEYTSEHDSRMTPLLQCTSWQHCIGAAHAADLIAIDLQTVAARCTPQQLHLSKPHLHYTLLDCSVDANQSWQADLCLAWYSDL